MIKDSLGDRMKGYENSFRSYLPKRIPVILRIDGKAFHSYTVGCKRPFDENLIECMNDTAIYLCSQIQNAMMAYVQSDEISILLNNYKQLETQSWFDNNLQKMTSVSASIAGAIFTANSFKIWGNETIEPNAGGDLQDYPIIKPAFFDSRIFILPREEVTNYFLWRQQDATRNSVQMLARTFYSHKECEDKNNSDLQEMIFQKGKNWNNFPTFFKRGRCIVKETYLKDNVERSKWIVDNEIPIFSQQRDYIDRYTVPLEDDNESE